MKLFKIALLFLALARIALADTASHRKVASDLLDIVSGPETVRAGVISSAEPMFDAIRQQGAPEPMIAEMKAALQDWIDKDFVWEELKPKLVDIYVREFSEEDLSQLLAFYKTPVGGKVLARLPTVFAEGIKIGQDYAQTKQATLDSRIMKVMAKFDPNLAAAQDKANAAAEKAAAQSKESAPEKK